jgi:hypothetical protein
MTETALLTVTDRIALARSYHADGRIIQNRWRDTAEDGREMVCALAAFGSDINSPDDCPAGLMPLWLAHLVPAIDDGIAEDQVPWFSGALIDCAARWHVLDDAAWDRIRTGFMVGALRQSIEAARPVQPSPEPDYWPGVVKACADVIAALQSGDPEQLRAAEAAEAAAARAAEAAARAAAWAAEAAARAAARAAEAAARAAAWAAAWAAARAAEAAAWAAAWAAARAAAWKSIAGLLFGLIEAEIAAAETEASLG